MNKKKQIDWRYVMGGVVEFLIFGLVSAIIVIVFMSL